MQGDLRVCCTGNEEELSNSQAEPGPPLPERHPVRSPFTSTVLRYYIPPSGLPSRHLSLDLVEALQHMGLQLEEGPVEHGGADLVKAAGDEAAVTDLAERQVAPRLVN